MIIKSKLAQRIIIWKGVWVIFWWIVFFLIPNILKDADLFLRFGLWLWYITLWALIWLFWIMTNHLVLKFSMPFWFRWIILGWWMNFIFCLFTYNSLVSMMKNTFLSWYSPFLLIIQWMIFWLIADYLATKFAWEWINLIKK